MKIKIITPEAIVFDGEVSSVLLPGINGEFHIMKNHAPVVSALANGKISLYDAVPLISESKKYIEQDVINGKNVDSYFAKGGVIEFKDNIGVILCE